MSKIQVVKVSDIKAPLYVRDKLDDKHVEMLATLIVDGTKLPPITLTPDLRLIDGWHRVQAYKYLELETIEADITQPKDEAEHVTMAFQANLGGAKPPTRDDYSHAVLLLVERGMGLGYITKAIGLGAAETRKFITLARDSVNKRKLREATALIVEQDLTIPEAASRVGLETIILKNALSGKKKKDTRSEMNRHTLNITTRARGYSGQTYKMLETIQNDVADGKLTKEHERRVVR